MRTTITIDDELIANLMQIEDVRNRSEAIRRALRAYIHRKRVEEFQKLAGSELVDGAWEEWEELEMDEIHKR